MFSAPPGSLFTKTEPPPSTGATYKYLSSVKVQPGPSAAPTSTPPSSSTNQDFPTIDVQGFAFSMFSPTTPDQTRRSRDTVPGNTPATMIPHEIQNSYVDDNEILDFPSFPETPSVDVENINIDEFQAMLRQFPADINPETTLCHSNMAATPSDHSAAPNNTEEASRNVSNNTWLFSSPIIASILQHEQNVDVLPSSGPVMSATLDDMDMLSFTDEDRLMSIINNCTQIGSLPGHPT